MTFNKRDREPTREHLQEIYGYAPIGICHVGMDGPLTTANPEFAWMLGYESPDMAVAQITDFATDVFHEPDTAEAFLFTLYEAEQVSRFRCRLKRKTGAPIWAQCYAKITSDGSGRANGFNCYAVDIGETVRAEKHLKAANAQLTALSIIDGLTKIPNRRKFDQTLETEWCRHMRLKTGLSTILCDIDFFKRYNDTYGHQAGDSCLEQVARAIDNCVNRPCDLAARYGGEEFGIILPDTGIEGARVVAEKIRKQVGALGIPHKGSQTSPCLTLSLGAAALVPEPGMSRHALVELADRALYQAKAGGRNRTIALKPSDL